MTPETFVRQFEVTPQNHARKDFVDFAEETFFC
jgi:hypothetical protein